MELVAHQQLIDGWKVQQAGMCGGLRRRFLAADTADDQRRSGSGSAAQAGTTGPGQFGKAGAAQVKFIVARLATDQAAQRQQHTKCRLQEASGLEQAGMRYSVTAPLP
jgi:hypothetical protein